MRQKQSQFQHQSLAAGRWQDMSFCQQMANIGSEVSRAIKWKNKKRPDYSQKAFHRALELMALTIKGADRYSKLKELIIVKEVLVDYFAGDNRYGSSDELWLSYFNHFAYAARKK
jgi:hypothetical protein